MRCRYGLAIGYGAIALVAVVQLIRIQMRVPEYGWTTQKVFHLLNFLVASLRLGVFACWRKVGGRLEGSIVSVQFDACSALCLMKSPKLLGQNRQADQLHELVSCSVCTTQ